MNYWAIPGVKFREFVKVKQGVPSDSPDHIVKVICDYYKVTLDEISTPSRVTEVKVPRQVCMWFLMEYSKIGCTKIGKLFGDRDHTTVLAAKQRIQDLIDTEPTFSNTINQIKENLYYRTWQPLIEPK